MKIRLLAPVENTRGTFLPGSVVDWPEATARPLIDGGQAELARRAARPVSAQVTPPSTAFRLKKGN